MNKIKGYISIIMMVLLVSGGVSVFAQDNELTAFSDGDLISAADMNANFQALLSKIRELEANTVGAGTIMAFAGEIDKIPEGWLLCDGSYYGKSEYAKLYAAIEDIHGESGGSFRVPDLRGMFLRGVDKNLDGESSGNDPDGLREVGNKQEDQLKSHDHRLGLGGGNPSRPGDIPVAFGGMYWSSVVPGTTSTKYNGGDETQDRKSVV